MLVAFAMLAAINLVLFLHPYATYPLSLMMLRKRPVQRDRSRPLPSATAVFSAYNEAPVLPSKLANLRAIKALHPGIEFLCYSDCSSDGTLTLLEEASDIVTVIPSNARAGKATGMRKMVAAAHGEVVIFTDANVILQPDTVANLLGYFSDPTVGGVAGTLRYINDDESPTAKVGGLYWQLEELLKRLESGCGSIMGADGSIFATRRALYPEVPPHLLDDMTVSMTVTFHGLRLIHATDVVAYERNTTSSADEFRRKRRIACRAFNTHRHLWPQIWRHYAPIDLYKYISHKLLRWFGLIPLTLAFFFTAAALIVAGHSGLALVFGLVAVVFIMLGQRGVRPFSLISEMALAIVATLYGIFDSWTGKTYQTWAPAVSRN